MYKTNLDDFIKLCGEIRSIHGFVLGLLPQDEKDRHERWFKANMMFNDEFIVNTKVWLSNCVFESDAVNNDGKISEDDNVSPNDSISNVGKILNKSESSYKSTTSSARFKVAAERAALVARMAALKERRTLEEWEQQIKKIEEWLELKTELAANTAKLVVLQASDGRSSSHTPSNGMNSFFEKEK